MSFTNELDVDVVRRSFAIKSRVRRLCAGRLPSDDEETESSCWFKTLNEEHRTSLESDAARLGSDGEGLSDNVSGPLGELLSRFSVLLRAPRESSNPANSELPTPTRTSPSEEIGEILLERGDLEHIDPIWFDDWEAFEATLDADD